MRILFFTHYFPPEVNAPATRTFEHCREWVRAGHEVHVITCIPSHPHGTPFQGFRRAWYRRNLVDGIHVHRVWTYLAPNRGVVRRTLNYLSFAPMAVVRALRLGRFDVAVGTSPQFFCAVAAWIYTRACRTPFVFELRDLWPESIGAVGAFRASVVLRLLARIELRLYHDAEAVVCLTEAFIRSLQNRGIDAAKLHWIPNGVDMSFWEADRAVSRAALEVRDDEVLACYAGTIGMAHGLETLMQAARSLRVLAPRVRIVIAGDGAELRVLRDIASRDGLDEVRFMGLVPRQSVPGILAASDIALVTLRPAPVFSTVLPSKMFEAMAAGKPIVLAVDGEASDMLARAAGGVAVPPGDADSLAAAIAHLALNPRERVRMGASAQRFVATEFSRNRWADRYSSLLAGISKTAADARPASSAAVRLGN